MRKSSDHKVANDNNETGEKAVSDVYVVSDETPTYYARKMVERESRGNGDQMNALDRVAQCCGMSARALRRIISKETKDPGIKVSARIERAYVEQCRRMIVELENEIAKQKARHGNDRLKHFDDEVSALRGRVDAAIKRMEQAAGKDGR